MQGDSPTLDVIRNPEVISRKRTEAKPAALSVGVRSKPKVKGTKKRTRAQLDEATDPPRWLQRKPQPKPKLQPQPQPQPLALQVPTSAHNPLPLSWLNPMMQPTMTQQAASFGNPLGPAGCGVRALLTDLQQEVCGWCVLVPVHANCHRNDLAFKHAIAEGPAPVSPRPTPYPLHGSFVCRTRGLYHYYPRDLVVKMNPKLFENYWGASMWVRCNFNYHLVPAATPLSSLPLATPGCTTTVTGAGERHWGNVCPVRMGLRNGLKFGLRALTLA